MIGALNNLECTAKVPQDRRVYAVRPLQLVCQMVDLDVLGLCRLLGPDLTVHRGSFLNGADHVREQCCYGRAEPEVESVEDC